MGYNVTLTNVDFLIPTENLEDSLVALKLLNLRDDLKTGGSWSGGQQTEKWFSWMPPDYDKTVQSSREVLEMLGFGTSITEDGLHVWEYDSKTGAEVHFIRALAPYAVEGSFMQWRGEDDSFWRWTVEEQQLSIEYGEVVWVSA